jgi:hypothetical protein
MTDDDLEAFGRREDHESALCGAGTDCEPKIQCAPGKGNTTVTIYHGKDYKLYDVVPEGELLGRRRRCVFGGIAVYRGEGEWNE